MNYPFPEFFRYRRDKGSAFGHGARTRDPVKAWLETKSFLDAYTDYELTQPVEVSLKVANGEFDRKLYESIVSFFGKPDTTNEHWFQWRSNRSFESELNAFILEKCKYSPGYDYDMSIGLYFAFRWKVLDKELLSRFREVFQSYFRTDYHGKFSVSIDNRVFIQPEFVIPIDNWGNFHAFVSRLVEDLPFRFSSKSFIAYHTRTLKSGKKRYKALGYYGQES